MSIVHATVKRELGHYRTRPSNRRIQLLQLQLQLSGFSLQKLQPAGVALQQNATTTSAWLWLQEEPFATKLTSASPLCACNCTNTFQAQVMRTLSHAQRIAGLLWLLCCKWTW